MSRQGRRPRMRMFLASRPRLADRIFHILGAKRLERIARRASIRAARRAYQNVPFYRERYKRAGFDERSMRQLTWRDFERLPIVGKQDIASVPDQDMLDATLPFPSGDAVITRSSGTTSKPTIMPVGWNEYYVTYALLKQRALDVGIDRARSVILIAYGVEGAPAAGSLVLRSYFSLKHETRWPFEVCAAGETPDTIISFLRYYAANGFETLYLLAFPGTMERVLDRLHELTAEDPDAGVDWHKFQCKRIQLSGQVVSRELRERIYREMDIAPNNLEAIEILLGSSDTGQVLAGTSPFTLWLERYMDQHPEIAERLGIPVEHRAKPLMEFVPSLSVYMENDPGAGLLLTTWKHWPLIRYRSNDLAWRRSSKEVVRTLNRVAKGWRKDFKRYGYRRRNVPRAAMLGMILGRVDDACIVNGANISPDILRDALATTGILPNIHHFKHGTGASPNEYDVYLELPDQHPVNARDLLAAQWQPGLLEALLTHPAATDLQTAHRGTPIDLKLFVRSRGEDEFEGDDQRAKQRFTLTHGPRVAHQEMLADAASAQETAVAASQPSDG